MSDLKSRLIKASTSKMTAELTKSKFFNEKDVVRTKIPMLNIAISGALDGGMQSGLTIFAGPSKHFKSNMSLTMVSAYLISILMQSVCSMIQNLVSLQLI